MDDPFKIQDQNSLESANPHVVQALEHNKREGLKLAVQARWIALAITSLLLVLTIQAWDALYYHAILAGLAINGWLQLRAGKVGRSRWELFLIFMDVLLMVFGMLYPNPFLLVDWPTATQYKFENFKYFYIFLAAITLGYSWRTVVAFGVWTSALWLIGMVLILLLGTTDGALLDALQQSVKGDVRLLDLIDPNNVRWTARIEEVSVYLIVAAILAAHSFRMNKLILSQAGTTRQRANLARHFPPSLVERLADRDQAFSETRAEHVVVMFVDIVGFTRLAERESPADVVDLLRNFHRRVEEAVFANHGTLDKYLGDGVMITFGTPEPDPQDVANCLLFVDTLIGDMQRWNEEREARGLAKIPVSMGAHYGSVILGDIGTERRLEYATLGDTVNVASRLEEMTRTLSCQCVISEALVEALEKDTPDQLDLMKPYTAHADIQHLRGRQAEVKIYTR